MVRHGGAGGELKGKLEMSMMEFAVQDNVGIWEPLWWILSGEFGDHEGTDPSALVGDVLLDLFDKGHVRFLAESVTDKANSAEISLSRPDAVKVFQEDWWQRRPIDTPPNDRLVVFRSTAEGERSYFAALSAD